MIDSRRLILERTFNAPRDLLFRMWTEPKHLAAWWGPKDFTNPVCEIDLRPGGAIRIDMKGPDGTVYPMTGTFKEIDPPKKLVFTSKALGPEGKPLLEVLTTCTFAAEGNRTRFKLDAKITKVVGDGAMYLAGMEEGWNQSLDRLEQLLEKTSK